MKDYKEMDKLVFDFGDDMNYFAQEYGNKMPPVIKTQLHELMYTGFAKEVDAISEREQIEIKYKKRFYDKLLKAKRKLASKDRADAWFDKVFQKYFNHGVLEHLITYAIHFLYKKDLFVPKRFFAQIGDDELLAEFTATACDYLGWTGQNEPAEQPTSDETEQIDEQPIDGEKSDNDEETNQEKEAAAVTVYEPKEVQPTDPPHPVVTVERTVTHEVVTATPGALAPTTQTTNDAAADVVEEQMAPAKSTPNFFRPGGKSGNKD